LARTPAKLWWKPSANITSLIYYIGAVSVPVLMDGHYWKRRLAGTLASLSSVTDRRYSTFERAFNPEPLR